MTIRDEIEETIVNGVEEARRWVDQSGSKDPAERAADNLSVRILHRLHRSRRNWLETGDGINVSADINKGAIVGFG